MSRAIFYCVVCLMLTTFAPISTKFTVAVEPPAGGELKPILAGRINEPGENYGAGNERSPEKNIETVEFAGENSEKKMFEVPIPGTVWLMAGGLLALVLIRRSNKK